jgi:hypothetical protein
MMPRYSSALLVVVLSMEALLCMSEAADSPNVRDILASKEFQVSMGKAWNIMILIFEIGI